MILPTLRFLSAGFRSKYPLLNHVSKCSITIEPTTVDYGKTPQPQIFNRKYLDGSECNEMPSTLPFANSKNLKAFRVKDNQNIVDAFQDISQLIDRNLINYGAILIRNLNMDRQMFADFISGTSGERFNYAGGNAARSEYEDSPGIMNATDDPPEVTIEPHIEMSYCESMPAKIFFYCATPPRVGEDGQTTVCDMQLVTKNLDKNIVGRLWKEGVRYHRWLPCEKIKKNYIYSWQKNFSYSVKNRG